MFDLKGKQFGRYQIVETLGGGGMAAVLKAYDPRLERYVAVKVILPSQKHTRSFLKRFEREAKAMAKLTHPNILSVIDYGQQDEQPYLILPYLAGGTLRDRMSKPLTWTEAARFLIPIAHALDYTHNYGIIHRDVKPGNILLTEMGEPMLADFGIAKLLEGADTALLSGTGMGIGTPDYMAPEQGRGESVDRRADVYALGAVFFEMVTGRKPFVADTPVAVILKHMTEPLPSPRIITPDLPEQVEGIILKAMAKDAVERYQTAAEFAWALEKISDLAGVPVQQSFGLQPPTQQRTRPASIQRAALPMQELGFRSKSKPVARVGVTPVPMLKPPVPEMILPVPRYPEQRRKPVPIWVWGTAVALVLIVLAGVSIPVLINLFARSSPTPPSNAMINSPTIRIDGVSSTASATESIPGLEIPSLTAGATATHTSTPTRISPSPTPSVTASQTASPTLSPTILGGGSGLIAFVSGRDGGSEIYTMRLDGSEQQNLTNKTGGDDEPAWSPDGKYIAYSSWGEVAGIGLFIMDANGANVRRVTPDSYHWTAYNIRWSPDGNYIAFMRGGTEQDKIYLVCPDGSCWKTLCDSPVYTDPSGRVVKTFLEGYTWMPDGKSLFCWYRWIQRVFIHRVSIDGMTLFRYQTRLTTRFILSPDGDRFLYDNSLNLYTWSLNGRDDPVRLTEDGSEVTDKEYEPVFWLKNGRIVYLYRNRENYPPQETYHSMNADGSDVKPYLYIPELFSFSPDGNYYAASPRSCWGDPAPKCVIDLVKADTGEVVVTLTSSGKDYAPAWQP